MISTQTQIIQLANSTISSALLTPPSKVEARKRAHLIATRLINKKVAALSANDDSSANVPRISQLSKSIKKTTAPRAKILSSVKLHGIYTARKRSAQSNNESSPTSQLYSSTQGTSADQSMELTPEIALDKEQQDQPLSVSSLLTDQTRD